MREIRRRERVVPDTREQVAAFIRSALPPVIARYALRLMRLALAIPLVRAIMLGILGVVLAFLLVPALLVGLVAWLATGSSATATMSAITVTVLAGVILGVVVARLYTRWRMFRERYLRRFYS